MLNTDMKLTTLTDTWREDPNVSALFISCSNYSDSIMGQPTYNNQSHNLKGVNGAFYDGNCA